MNVNDCNLYSFINRDFSQGEADRDGETLLNITDDFDFSQFLNLPDDDLVSGINLAAPSSPGVGLPLLDSLVAPLTPLPPLMPPAPSRDMCHQQLQRLERAFETFKKGERSFAHLVVLKQEWARVDGFVRTLSTFSDLSQEQAAELSRVGNRYRRLNRRMKLYINREVWAELRLLHEKCGLDPTFRKVIEVGRRIRDYSDIFETEWNKTTTDPMPLPWTSCGLSAWSILHALTGDADLSLTFRNSVVCNDTALIKFIQEFDRERIYCCTLRGDDQHTHVFAIHERIIDGQKRYSLYNSFIDLYPLREQISYLSKGGTLLMNTTVFDLFLTDIDLFLSTGAWTQESNQKFLARFGADYSSALGSTVFSHLELVVIENSERGWNFI